MIVVVVSLVGIHDLQVNASICVIIVINRTGGGCFAVIFFTAGQNDNDNEGQGAGMAFVFIKLDRLISAKADPLVCNCGKILDDPLAGCAYADAVDVFFKIKQKQDSLNHLYDIQYPWSCLACCGNDPQNDLARNVLSRIISLSRSANALFGQLNLTPENLLYPEPPGIIQRVMNGEQFNDGIFREFGIRYITVFRQPEG